MEPYQFIANVFVFKGENEVAPASDQIMEVVDFKTDGHVEFGVDGPKGTRIFITLDVGQLVGAAMAYLRPRSK